MATKKKDWKAEWEAVSKESRKLAKRANQRLVRLEQYSKREGMSEILKFAYKNAQEYISHNLGGKRFKEHVKLYDISDGTDQLSGDALLKANVMIQRQRIKEMEKFLGAESSTLGQSRSGPKTKGIKKIYEKRTQTINEKILAKYGLEMTDKDLKRFFDSKKQAKLESIVGSTRMFVVAAIMKKQNVKGSRRELENFVKNHVDLNQYKDELKADDLNMKKNETRREYVDRLEKYISYTDDKVLNDFVSKAIKEGINVKNIFI